MNLEPFPRQTLVGNQSGQTSFHSPIYDSTAWKSVSWWYECFGLLTTGSGILSPPMAFIETSESMNGPWMVLASQAAAGDERYTGTVTNPGSLMRVRIAVEEEMLASVAVRFVARAM